jgi:ABC-type transporter Mla subunit MlaD
MSKQPNSGTSNRSTLKAKDGDADSVGQAILSFLHTASNEAETNIQQALDTAQKLSIQLQAAQDRIADLEEVVRLYREKADRAENWLNRISIEIEDRLINEAEKRQLLH